MAYERDDGFLSFLESMVGLGLAGTLGYAIYKNKISALTKGYKEVLKEGAVGGSVADAALSAQDIAIKESIAQGTLSISPPITRLETLSGAKFSELPAAEIAAEFSEIPVEVIESQIISDTIINASHTLPTNISVQYLPEQNALRIVDKARGSSKLVELLSPFKPKEFENISLPSNLQNDFIQGSLLRKGRNVYVATPLSVSNYRVPEDILSNIAIDINKSISEGADTVEAAQRIYNQYRGSVFNKMAEAYRTATSGGRAEAVRLSQVKDIAAALRANAGNIRNVRDVAEIIESSMTKFDSVRGVSTGLVFAGHVGAQGQLIVSEPSAFRYAFSNKDKFLQSVYNEVSARLGSNALAREVWNAVIGLYAFQVSSSPSDILRARVKGIEKGFIPSKLFRENLFRYRGVNLYDPLAELFPTSKDIFHQQFMAQPGVGGGRFVYEGIYGGAAGKSPFTFVVPLEEEKAVDLIRRFSTKKKAKNLFRYLREQTPLITSFEGTVGFVPGTDIRNLRTFISKTKTLEGGEFLDVPLITERGEELVKYYDATGKHMLLSSLKVKTMPELLRYMKQHGGSIQVIRDLPPIAAIRSGEKALSVSAFKLKRGEILEGVYVLNDKGKQSLVFKYGRYREPDSGAVFLVGTKPETAYKLTRKTSYVNKTTKKASKFVRDEEYRRNIVLKALNISTSNMSKDRKKEFYKFLSDLAELRKSAEKKLTEVGNFYVVVEDSLSNMQTTIFGNKINNLINALVKDYQDWRTGTTEALQIRERRLYPEIFGAIFGKGRGGLVMMGTGAIQPTEMVLGLYTKYLYLLEEALGADVAKTKAKPFAERFIRRYKEFIKGQPGGFDLVEFGSTFNQYDLFEMMGLTPEEQDTFVKALHSKNLYKQFLNPALILLPASLRHQTTDFAFITRNKSFNVNDITALRLGGMEQTLESIKRLHKYARVDLKRKLFSSYLGQFTREAGISQTVIEAASTLSNIHVDQWKRFKQAFKEGDVGKIVEEWTGMFGGKPIYYAFPKPYKATYKVGEGALNVGNIREVLIPTLGDLGLSQTTLSEGKLISEGGLFNKAVDLLDLLFKIEEGRSVSPSAIDETLGKFMGALFQQAGAWNNALHNPEASGPFMRRYITGILPESRAFADSISTAEDLFTVRITEGEAKKILKGVGVKLKDKITIDELNDELAKLHNITSRTPHNYAFSMMPVRMKAVPKGTPGFAEGKIKLSLPLFVLFKGDMDADAVIQFIENVHLSSGDKAPEILGRLASERKEISENALKWLAASLGLKSDATPQAIYKEVYNSYERMAREKLEKLVSAGKVDETLGDKAISKFLEGKALTDAEKSILNELTKDFVGRAKLQSVTGIVTNQVFDLYRGIVNRGVSDLIASITKGTNLAYADQGQLRIVLRQIQGSIIQATIEKAEQSDFRSIVSQFLSTFFNTAVEEQDVRSSVRKAVEALMTQKMSETSELFTGIIGAQTGDMTVGEFISKFLTTKQNGQEIVPSVEEIIDFVSESFMQSRESAMNVYQSRSRRQNLIQILEEMNNANSFTGEERKVRMLESRKKLVEFLSDVDDVNAFLDEIFSSDYEFVGEPKITGFIDEPTSEAERRAVEALKQAIKKEVQRTDPAKGKLGQMIMEMFYNSAEGRMTGLGKASIIGLGLFGIGALLNIGSAGVHEYEPAGVGGAIKAGASIPAPPPNLGLGGPAGIVETPAHMSAAYTAAPNSGMRYNINGVHYAAPVDPSIDSSPRYGGAGHLYHYQRGLSGYGG